MHMPLSVSRTYDRLDQFLRDREGDISEEPFCPQHDEITRRVFGMLDGYHVLDGVKEALDVGKGPGFAVRELEKRGISCTAIDLHPNVQHALRMDQSFLNFETGTFDLVWSRHVLEHSIMPYFTLSEYFRVLRPGGICYIEVPAPGTPCQHECNLNHYSVMGALMWGSLMQRTGFLIDRTWAFDLDIMQSNNTMIKDQYLAFLLKKDRKNGG